MGGTNVECDALTVTAQIEGDVLASVILFAQTVKPFAAELVTGKVTGVRT